MKNNMLLERYIREYIEEKESLEEGKIAAGVSILTLAGAFLFNHFSKSSENVTPETVVNAVNTAARKRGNTIDDHLLMLVRKGAYDHKKLNDTIEQINAESEKLNKPNQIGKALSALIMTGINPDSVSLEHDGYHGIASTRRGWNSIDDYLSDPTLKKFMNLINVIKDYSSEEFLKKIDNDHASADSIAYSLHNKLKEYLRFDNLNDIDKRINYLKEEIEEDPDSEYYKKRVEALERLERYKKESENAFANIASHYNTSENTVKEIISTSKNPFYDLKDFSDSDED